MSILLLTSKSDVTTDFIVQKLTERNLPFYRFNTEELGKSIRVVLNFEKSVFDLIDDRHKKTINLLSFSSIYYRRPEIMDDFEGITEAEENFLKSELVFTLEGIYKILENKFWLNHVNAIRNAENKLYQLLLAKEIGFNIPNSLVSNEPSAVLNFYNTHCDNISSAGRNCIVKPIKSGLISSDKEVGVIFTTKIEIDEKNVQRIVSCPVYIQPLILKKADIRVTLVGKYIFAALIDTAKIPDAETDWRKSEQNLSYHHLELPTEIQNQCLKLMEKLDLNFGAIDFILDENDNYIFLEINPNGQWAWIEKRLNYPIANAITTILEEKMVQGY